MPSPRWAPGWCGGGVRTSPGPAGLFAGLRRLPRAGRGGVHQHDCRRLHSRFPGDDRRPAERGRRDAWFRNAQASVEAQAQTPGEAWQQALEAGRPRLRPTRRAVAELEAAREAGPEALRALLGRLDGAALDLAQDELAALAADEPSPVLPDTPAVLPRPKSAITAWRKTPRRRWSLPRTTRRGCARRGG